MCPMEEQSVLLTTQPSIQSPPFRPTHVDILVYYFLFRRGKVYLRVVYCFCTVMITCDCKSALRDNHTQGQSFLMGPLFAVNLSSGSGDLSLILLHPHGSFMHLLKTELSPVDIMVIFYVYVYGTHVCRYVCLHVCEPT